MHECPLGGSSAVTCWVGSESGALVPPCSPRKDQGDTWNVCLAALRSWSLGPFRRCAVSWSLPARHAASEGGKGRSPHVHPLPAGCFCPARVKCSSLSVSSFTAGAECIGQGPRRPSAPAGLSRWEPLSAGWSSPSLVSPGTCLLLEVGLESEPQPLPPRRGPSPYSSLSLARVPVHGMDHAPRFSDLLRSGGVRWPV